MLVITVEGTYELERADPRRPRRAGVVPACSIARTDGPAKQAEPSFG